MKELDTLTSRGFLSGNMDEISSLGEITQIEIETELPDVIYMKNIILNQ